MCVYSICSYLIPCNLYFFFYCILYKRKRLKTNDPVIITIAVECGDPGKPTNAKHIVKKGYFYGGSVKFVCDENYTLVGADVMFCQANKSWSSSVPRCVGKCHWVREKKRHLPSNLARAQESITNSNFKDYMVVDWGNIIFGKLAVGNFSFLQIRIITCCLNNLT